MSQESNNEDLIKAAVDYWAKFLGQGDYRADRELNGVEGALMVYAKILANKGATPKDKKIEAFKTILAEKIRTRIKDGADRVYMGTDYYPEGLLSDALQEAGVSGSFPQKDSVTLDVVRGTVTQSQVRVGDSILFERDKPVPRVDETEKGRQDQRIINEQGTELNG